MTEKKYRVAILFSELSSYMLACWKALKTEHNVELLVYYWKPVKDAPFKLDLEFITHLYPREGHTATQISDNVSTFNPDAVIIAGWMDKGYLEAARRLKRKNLLIIATCDNQWQDTPRQHLAARAAPWHLHPAIDVLWVAGERQAQFAKRLGYRGPRLWRGLYCCDWEHFAYEPSPNSTNTFLFVGRLATEKGINTLINAYSIYREQVESSWPLLTAGTGNLSALVEQCDGVQSMGFTQPDKLPLLFCGSGCFVLPSHKEPWGVVLQEAAASGLPLICSEACGASVHLLQDGYNGYLFETGNVDHLAECLTRISGLSSSERLLMGRRSHEMSKQFTPKRWAQTLVEGLERWSTGQ
jgi:glycosyltransferase involved in cell wall biosynthesis